MVQPLADHDLLLVSSGETPGEVGAGRRRNAQIADLLLRPIGLCP
jgi:hypothetical protein